MATDNQDLCYICYDGFTEDNKGLQPCLCKGSMYIHTGCLKEILNHNITSCKTCKKPYNIELIYTLIDYTCKLLYYPRERIYNHNPFIRDMMNSICTRYSNDPQYYLKSNIVISF